jgi:tetratricopeptide (TPR) repeat protein
MKNLVEKYPEDLDAATLYAAAIMNTNPWDYWYRDGTPKPYTQTVLETLSSVLERNPDHAAANHYWIYTVEAYRPELGEAAADRLLPLMPGAGHLVHMPSHIYMRLGRYEDSWDVNAAAAVADETYISQCKAQGIVPIAYYPHNIHFQVWSAMFLGDSANAMKTARKIEEKMPAHIRDNPFGVIESFRSQPMFAMVRFGMWEQALGQKEPPEDALYMRGIWHYGRGMAFTHTGESSKARKELKKLVALRDTVAAQDGYNVGFGAGQTLMSIAGHVLRGEIRAKSGDYVVALSQLDKAVRLEDSLLYNEPPDWYFPVRHILGAVLLEANRPAEAEVVYWEDLRRNPANGYSLFGLIQSLEAQEKFGDLGEIKRRFAAAWKKADHTLSSSRY